MSKNALRLAAALLVALAFLPCAATAAAGKIAAAGERWRWVSNARFEVLTNGSESRARKVIEELETYRAAIRQMMGGEVSDPPEPVRVLLFDRVWDMTPYQQLTAEGKPESWAGYFVYNGPQTYFALSNESDEAVPGIVFGGYAYRLTAAQLRDQPQWLRTGLIEYLSEFRYVARERRAEIGRPNGGHLRYLNASTHAPLRQIVTMSQDSPAFARDVPRSLFFAKSWLVVHYLQVGSPQRAGALARFAQMRSEGVGDVEALEKATGATLVELDQELSVYQRRSLMSFATLALDPPAPEQLAARPADTADALFRLGEYLLAIGPERRADALAHFAAAGRPEPSPPAQVAVRSLDYSPVPAAPPAAPAKRSAHASEIEAVRAAIDAREFDKARAAIEVAIARAPADAQEFEPLLIDLDTREADRLALAGDFESGERLLSARAAATSATNRAQADTALAIFRSRTEFVRNAAEYGAALDLINAQKVEEGAQALRKFLADHPDSEQASAARANLEKVEAYLARRRARQQQQSPPPQPPA